MSLHRVCDRCGLAPEQHLLRRLSLVYSDGTMVTARFCAGCYAWAVEAARVALFEPLGAHPKPARGGKALARHVTAPDYVP